MPVLLVKTKHETQTYQLPEGMPLFIGRAKECDIVLPSPAVSRRHAVVLFRDGICGVKDLGSFNGSTLNGTPINGACHLRENDTLKISSFIIRFVLRETAAKPSASADGTDAPAQSKSPRPDSRTFANGLRLPRAMSMTDEVDAQINAIAANAPKMESNTPNDTRVFTAGSQTETFIKNEEDAARGNASRTPQPKPDTTRKLRKDEDDRAQAPEDSDGHMSPDETRYFMEPPPPALPPSPPPEAVTEKTKEENEFSLIAEEIIPLLEPESNPVLQLEASETEGGKDETHTALEKLIEKNAGPIDCADLPPLATDEYDPPMATDEFPAASAVDADAETPGTAARSDSGGDMPPISSALKEAIGARLAVYTLLNDLAEERKLLRMTYKDMAPELAKELERQDSELECLPTTEEVETQLQKAQRRQAARQDGRTTEPRQSIEDMAVSQWLLIRDSNRESLPTIYKEAYRLAADEPLARELARTKIAHGRLFGGAVYYLALESMADSAAKKRTRISTRIRKLAEEGTGKSSSRVLSRLGRLGKIADNYKNRAEIRHETDKLTAEDKQTAFKASLAAREMAFMEKVLIREFRQLYCMTAIHYVPDGENMPFPVRAFLRHGAISFNAWWMRPDVRDFLVGDCRENVIRSCERGADALNVLYADEYLTAVSAMDCSPLPDDSLSALDKAAEDRKADRAYRRIVNSRGYTVLMKELLGNLDVRLKALELEANGLDNKVREVRQRQSGTSGDALFDLQTEQQAVAIRSSNLKGHIQRIVTEVVSSIIDSVQEAEGRFRKGEYKLPEKEELIRREAEALLDLASRMEGPKERFFPLIIRDQYSFAKEILNGRGSVRSSIEECEKCDPGIFMNTIIPAKKKTNRIELRLSPTVVIVPSFGLHCVCPLAREGMEGGHLVIPSCFARENARKRQIANLLADYRWETAKSHAGRDVMNSDTLAGAFMKIRWEWRNFPKARREKGLILNDLNDQHNWRRIYELYLSDAMTGCRQLLLRNPDCYFAIIGKYIDLPDGVRMLRKG